MDEQKLPESDVEYEDEFHDPEDEDNPVSRMDYIHSVMPPAKPKKLWPRIVGTVVLICLVGTGIFFIAPHIHLHSGKPAKQPSDTVTSKTLAKSSTAKSQNAAYVSNGNDLNLTFDYPKSWSVSPPTDENPADQPITAKSPTTSMQVDGQQKTVQAVVIIRPGSSTLTELGSGSANAGLASSQFGYSQPTPTQDKFPYLTYINLNGGSDTNGTFEEVVVSGQQQLQQGASITSSTITVDPLITASFYSCETSSCKSETPLPITAGELQQGAVFKQSMQLIESLEFN